MVFLSLSEARMSHNLTWPGRRGKRWGVSHNGEKDLLVSLGLKKELQQMAVVMVMVFSSFSRFL